MSQTLNGILITPFGIIKQIKLVLNTISYSQTTKAGVARNFVIH